jgi:hypothetical protein
MLDLEEDVRGARRSGETADGTTGYRVAAERQAVAPVALRSKR